MTVELGAPWESGKAWTGREPNNLKLTLKWCVLRSFFIKGEQERGPTSRRGALEGGRAGQTGDFLWVPKVTPQAGPASQMPLAEKASPSEAYDTGL